MKNYFKYDTVREIIEAYWNSDFGYGTFPEFMNAEAEEGGAE